MHRFYDGDRQVEIPTALDELSSAQYLFFVTLSGLYCGTSMSEKEYRERWFAYLAGLDITDFSLLVPDKKKLYRDEMVHTDGFFKKLEDGSLGPEFYTTSNLLPSVKEGDNVYEGPGDLLEGMTFGEFTECMAVMSADRQPEETDLLNVYGHIARVMYHVPEGNSIPDILYFHAPTLFRNVLKHIESSPIEINGREIDFGIIFRSAGDSDGRQDDRTGWAGVTFEVASSGIFGDLKGVEKADLWTVLLYLYRCKFEYLQTKNRTR